MVQSIWRLKPLASSRSHMHTGSSHHRYNASVGGCTDLSKVTSLIVT